MAEAALTRARDFHVSHADFRFERIRSQDIRVRDGRLQGANDAEDLGFAVRVILDGAWGFASVWCSAPSRRSAWPRPRSAPHRWRRR